MLLASINANKRKGKINCIVIKPDPFKYPAFRSFIIIINPDINRSEIFFYSIYYGTFKADFGDYNKPRLLYFNFQLFIVFIQVSILIYGNSFFFFRTRKQK